MDLGEVFTPTGDFDELRDGYVATDPDADGHVEVVTPGFADDLRHGPCPVMPRGVGMPERGDRCLVAFGDDRRPWVVAWDGPITTTGEPGPEGPEGPEGPAGPQGPKGDQGLKGDTGSQGPKGDTGAKGETGATGATGPEGPKGATGATGPEGPQGPKGDTGATGIEGASPVGAILLFPESVSPTGWLACDGAAVSRTTYATLFGEIGTDYGAGNGTTTFNVPDLSPAFFDIGGGETGVYRIKAQPGVDAGIAGPEGPPGPEGPEGSTGPEGPKGATGPEGPPGSSDFKDSVKCCTTANVTISTALNSGDSVDGVTLANGDRVLVANQTTQSQNGIYIVSASPARSTDADAVGELSGGSQVYVEQGTIYGDRVMAITTNGAITPGTTAHTWAPVTPKDHGVVESLPTTAALKSDTCTFKAAAGIYWSLVYTGEATYPWAKVGGPALNAYGGGGSFSTESFGSLGVSITLPAIKVDGIIDVGATSYNGTANAYSQTGLKIGAEATADFLTHHQPSTGAAQHGGEMASTRKELAASTVVKIEGRQISGGTAQIFGAWLKIDPVRVG